MIKGQYIIYKYQGIQTQKSALKKSGKCAKLEFLTIYISKKLYSHHLYGNTQ